MGYIKSETSIGTKYKKALYKGYTDATFQHYSEQPYWAGFQGPLIRAEVGDMIEIMFYNKMDPFYASIHSMGLFYDHAQEGSLYYSGSPLPSQGDAVAPGECVVYKW